MEIMMLVRLRVTRVSILPTESTRPAADVAEERLARRMKFVVMESA